jgi:type VI secretion system secreted protein Hcp
MRYIVRLTNATIVDIRFRMLNNKNPDLMRYAEYEEVAFDYQKIEWTWVLGNVVASDDWGAGQVSAPKTGPAVKAPARVTRKRS